MTVQLRDSDGTVRLAGDLLATGGATGDVLTQQADGTYAPAGGVPIVRGPFPFAFNTPGLTNGVAFGWTPAAGDVLVDAWFEIDTAWDGTTPSADIGPFSTFTYGVWSPAEPVDLSIADFGAAVQSMSQNSESGSTPSLAGTGFHTATQQRKRHAPGSIYVSEPWKVVVSQDGTKGGGDPGSAQGAARLYIVTATPAAF